MPLAIGLRRSRRSGTGSQPRRRSISVLPACASNDAGYEPSEAKKRKRSHRDVERPDQRPAPAPTVRDRVEPDVREEAKIGEAQKDESPDSRHIDTLLPATEGEVTRLGHHAPRARVRQWSEMSPELRQVALTAVPEGSG